jgi:hypothetical protein
LDGHLNGNGWTVGGYFGWQLMPGVRLNGTIAHAWITYDAQSGAASGTIPADRWIGTLGLTGSATFGAWQIEPSAGAYIVWENESAYVDSLGVAQAERDFRAGRASVGTKMTYPTQWRDVALAPYVGLYGDYYFSSDTALLTGLATAAELNGFSVRLTTGIGAEFNGYSLSLGAEFGGLGSDYFNWIVGARLSTRF